MVNQILGMEEQSGVGRLREVLPKNGASKFRRTDAAAALAVE